MSTDIDFLEVYKEYQPKILRYLSRFVGPNDAEDVAQEVFGKVSRSLESFRSESKLSMTAAISTTMKRARLPAIVVDLFSGFNKLLYGLQVEMDEKPWYG